MKKIFQKKAFSLIEIMIVISIMMIVLMFSYAPYSLYQNKAKVKLATREVSQSLYEARNMAISWVQEKENSWNIDFKNKAVWILLDTTDNQNWKIKYFYFDSEVLDNDLNVNNSKIDISWKPAKEKEIQPWVFLTSFPETSSSKILLIYKASTWEIVVLDWDSKSKISWNTLKIELKFQKSDSELLKRTITYYLKTNIVDYK